MKYTTILTGAFCLASTVAATPTSFPIINMTFQGGPAQYTISFPVNDVVYPIDNDMTVDMIHAGDYNLGPLCTFTTDYGMAIERTRHMNMVKFLVGPPQPIRGVRCSSVCLAIGATCSDGVNTLGTCCTGYCNYRPEDRKCNAWIDPWNPPV